MEHTAAVTTLSWIPSEAITDAPLLRAPFEENWISFAEKNQHAFALDLMYFGDDGKPVFMPPADEPVPSTNHPYSPTTVQLLEPVPPVAHDTFADTFK